MIHYNSQLSYQKDSKFIPVGINSIRRMNVLSQSGGYLFVHKDSSGFVFCERQIDRAKDGDNLLPVMVIKLRESGISGWKQAHGLRIRKYYADESVAKKWYFEYVRQVAPLVSDTEHLQGGYLLWKHFLKYYRKTPLRISAWNINTKERLATDLSTRNIEESNYWSQHPDRSKSNVVLSMEYLNQPENSEKDTQQETKVRLHRDMTQDETLDALDWAYDYPDEFQHLEDTFKKLAKQVTGDGSQHDYTYVVKTMAKAMEMCLLKDSCKD